MNTTLIIVAYIVGIIELVVGLFFLITSSGQVIRKILGSLGVSVAAWTIISAYLVNAVSIEINRIIYALGILFITILLHFSLEYPVRFRLLNTFSTVLLYVPTVILMLLSLFSSSILKGSEILSSGYVWPVGGDALPFYNGYIFILWIITIIILFYNARTSELEQKRNIQMIVWSIVIGGLPAAYTDLIAPLISGHTPNPLYGNIATIIWIGSIMYIAGKKNVLENN